MYSLYDSGPLARGRIEDLHRAAAQGQLIKECTGPGAVVRAVRWLRDRARPLAPVMVAGPVAEPGSGRLEGLVPPPRRTVDLVSLEKASAVPIGQPLRSPAQGGQWYLGADSIMLGSLDVWAPRGTVHAVTSSGRPACQSSPSVAYTFLGGTWENRDGASCCQACAEAVDRQSARPRGNRRISTPLSR